MYASHNEMLANEWLNFLTVSDAITTSYEHLQKINNLSSPHYISSTTTTTITTTTTTTTAPARKARITSTKPDTDDGMRQV
ncbi:hypothetical protein E2C01_095242 [Portunus trituberculatus]|uniref:Uncharacterized protein n=1 Tax=Portunus trituberculatus TaxID=210409 RepID=A0A5B7JUR7_PORTR|nr:hypothetical protein [Portunus trituberculatus]